MIVPWRFATGILLKPSSVVGESLTRMSYSSSPIFAVPPGCTTFCAPRAFSMSPGARPFACMAAGFRLIMMERCLPPYTFGTTAPFTVTSCGRMKFKP